MDLCEFSLENSIASNPMQFKPAFLVVGSSCKNETSALNCLFYLQHRRAKCQYDANSGTPVETRTLNLLIRRQYERLERLLDYLYIAHKGVSMALGSTRGVLQPSSNCTVGIVGIGRYSFCCKNAVKRMRIMLKNGETGVTWPLLHKTGC